MKLRLSTAADKWLAAKPNITKFTMWIRAVMLIISDSYDHVKSRLGFLVCMFVILCACQSFLVETAVRMARVRLGSERNDRIGAPVGHAFCLAFSPTLTPPFRLDHRRKTTANKSLPVPLSASRYPFFNLFVFLFSLYFRQRRSTLSRSSTALGPAYAPEHSLKKKIIHFSLFSLTFSLFSFYNFPERLAQRRRVYLPIPDADPPTNGYDYQGVGTHVFIKQASSSRTALDILLISI
jgi:hypothetical protein